MFTKVPDCSGKVRDLESYVVALKNVIECQDKKLNYAIERIAILESYRKELGEFLDKFLKASGCEYKFIPTKLANYDIVKTPKK